MLRARLQTLGNKAVCFKIWNKRRGEKRFKSGGKEFSSVPPLLAQVRKEFQRNETIWESSEDQCSLPIHRQIPESLQNH